jgi:hypothetical protein
MTAVPALTNARIRASICRTSADSVTADFYAMHGMEPEDFQAPRDKH